MAAVMAAGSAMSPTTISASSSARLPRGLEARASRRKRAPLACSARATADPTKPDAPVTRTRSPPSSLAPIALGSALAVRRDQAASLRRALRNSKNSAPSRRRRFIMSGLRTISPTIEPILLGRR